MGRHGVKAGSQVAVLLTLLLLLLLMWAADRLPSYSGLKGDPVNIRSADQSAVGVDDRNVSHVYSRRAHPFIFIGGHPRSGTTLMRAMLDAHPWVRCGEETRILTPLLSLRRDWRDPDERARLLQGGIYDQLIDDSIAAFVLELIVKHGHPAKVLCNKDPLTLAHGVYLNQLFPSSRWIFMVRDGRAVVHSIVKRKITITGYDNDDPRTSLISWNKQVNRMKKQCDQLGPARCLRVNYEQLVLHPRKSMEKILKYLELPWAESVLHHEELINKVIRVSNRERSSDQVVKPVNLEALTEWVGTFPADLLKTMDQVAPMLRELGYDPSLNPPNYGIPDPEVLNNTKNLEVNREFWIKHVTEMINKMMKATSPAT